MEGGRKERGKEGGREGERGGEREGGREGGGGGRIMTQYFSATKQDTSNIKFGGYFLQKCLHIRHSTL